MPALYSDFRGLRTTNPDGYQANVSAWRKALASLVRAGLAPASSSSSSSPNHTILTADESLLRALESKQYGRPLALGAVIREAMQQKDLIPLPDFVAAKESIYHHSWAAVPWAVAAWGLRQLGLTGAFTFGSDDRLPGGQFVVVANLEEASRSLAEQTAALTSRFERTFSKVQFQAEFRDSVLKGQRLSETDMEVLLKFMARDQGLLLYDGKTIKVKSTTEEPTTTTAITAQDGTIASLKELTGYLQHQTAVLGKKVEELAAAAKDAVARKNRVAALAALQSKKRAEASLQARFATLAQIEAVAAQIEQAADNVQLVNVMGASTGVLKDLNAQVGGAEGVEDVVGRLREQMGQADEVSSILAEQQQGPVVVDEGEIDDELEAMEQEKRKEDEQRRKRELLERARKEAREQREAEATARKLAELDALKLATGEPQATEEGADSKTSTERIAEPTLES